MARYGKLNHIKQSVTNMVTPICQRHGFVQASILLDWPEIVGKFANYCQPLKVVFPYQQRRQGQLHIRVSSGMATELVYLEPLILEKINRYFGYEAISRLTLRQGPVESVVKEVIKETPIPQTRIKELEESVATIEDDKLRQALLALRCGIERRS